MYPAVIIAILLILNQDQARIASGVRPAGRDLEVERHSQDAAAAG
jgi:hypothetical protein